MHWGCGPRPLLRGWFREDGLRGQSLNMVLTIITINSNYTILFLICSQINNIIIKQTLTEKGPQKVIINCSSLVVPLHTFSSLVTYFNSGHCTKLAVFQFVYSGTAAPVLINRADRFTLWLVNGQAFSLPLLKNFRTTNTMQRSNTIIKICFNH